MRPLIPESGCGQTDVASTEVDPTDATQAPSAILASLPKPSLRGGPSLMATSMSHLPPLEASRAAALVAQNVLLEEAVVVVRVHHLALSSDSLERAGKARGDITAASRFFHCNPVSRFFTADKV